MSRHVAVGFAHHNSQFRDWDENASCNNLRVRGSLMTRHERPLLAGNHEGAFHLEPRTLESDQ